MKQTCRERIGGLLLHRSIPRHLISALLPTFAVSHDDASPWSAPQARAHWFPELRSYCGAIMGTGGRIATKSLVGVPASNGYWTKLPRRQSSDLVDLVHGLLMRPGPSSRRYRRHR